MENKALFTVIGSRDPIALRVEKDPDGNTVSIATEGSALSIIRKLNLKKAYCYVSLGMSTTNNVGPISIKTDEDGKEVVFAKYKGVTLYECEPNPTSVMSEYLAFCHDFDDVEFIYFTNKNEKPDDIVKTTYLYELFMNAQNKIRETCDEIIISGTSGTPSAKDALYYLASKASNNLKCYSSRNPKVEDRRKRLMASFEDAIFESTVTIEDVSYMAVVDTYEQIKQYISSNKFDSAQVLFDELDWSSNDNLKKAHTMLSNLNDALSFRPEYVSKIHLHDADQYFLSLMFQYQKWLMDKKSYNSVLLTLDSVVEVLLHRFFRDMTEYIVLKSFPDDPMRQVNQYDLKEYTSESTGSLMNISLAKRFLKVKYMTTLLNYRLIDEETLKSMASIAVVSCNLRNSAAHGITSLSMDDINNMLATNLGPGSSASRYAQEIETLLRCTDEEIRDCDSFSKKGGRSFVSFAADPQSPYAHVGSVVVRGYSNVGLFDSLIDDEMTLYRYVFGENAPVIHSLDEIKKQIIDLIK